jgi:Bacterial mobilisation protein (MobC)
MASGSENRQRTKIIPVRVNAEEYALITKVANATGQSAAALVRSALARIPLPRTRLPKAVDKLVARFLGGAAKVADPLWALDAQLGKIGSNINQLTHYAHMDRVMEASIMSALAEFNEASARVKEALRDVDELRTEGMHVLGLEPPNHKGPERAE